MSLSLPTDQPGLTVGQRYRWHIEFINGQLLLASGDEKRIFGNGSEHAVSGDMNNRVSIFILILVASAVR